MKYWSFIFAILLLGLNFVPCADKGDCATVNLAHVENHDHEEQNQESNHCSPLCVCCCCNTVTVQYEPLHIEDSVWLEFLTIKEPEFKLPIVTPIYFPIWQPPQLV